MTKKRIIAAVLLVYMVLSAFFFVSCGDDQLAAFSKAISATKPSKVEGSVKMYTEFGPLTVEYDADIAEDGSFVLNYAYDVFNSIESADKNDVTGKVEGTVTYKDGAFSDTSLAAKIPAEAVAAKVKLSDKMTYTVSDDGNVLAATIKAANTKSVLGVEYEADVSMVLTKANDKIASLSLTYTLAEGKVEVVCSYK